MEKGLEQFVRHRAGQACEYCGFPAVLAELPLVTDHVIARQHRGATTAENLALSCGLCNRHKGPNIAGLDPPPTGVLTRLFNPRTDCWSEHFARLGVRVVPLTDIGRTTEYVLALNDPGQLRRRLAHADPGS